MRGIQGFTLVELSIVIIIIGFLIAGVAAGTSLIKQAELNSVITDFQGYQTSYNTFINRYDKAPGDFDAAGSIWPQCTAVATTCNGNANGIIDDGGGASGIANEGVLAWKQLSLADVISSGIQDPATTYTEGILKVGISAPSSKVGGAGYMMFLGSDAAAAGSVTALWNDNKTNAVMIGTQGGGLFLDHGALTPEQAFNIDMKLDDGAINSSVTPAVFSGTGTGFIRAFAGNGAVKDCLDLSVGINYAVGSKGAGCVVAMALN